MPRRARAEAAQSPAAAATPDPDAEEDEPQQDQHDDGLLFYNTTFTLYRTSPFYVGTDTLTPERLQTLSQRLRNVLVGDVVRGVVVGLQGDDAALGAAGALEAVDMQWLSAEELLGRNIDVLSIALHYENSTASALLLPDGNVETEQGPFIHLPLLLLRTPVSLRGVITDFLRTTFDCRVTAMALQTQDIVGAWEHWVKDTRTLSKGPYARNAVISLGFDMSKATKSKPYDTEAHGVADLELGLKSIDLDVPATDVRRFLQAGMRMDGDKQESRPFMAALVKYAQKHLALDLSHPSVRILRIACGGFVLSEHRLKFSEPPSSDQPEDAALAPIQRLLTDLVLRAKGPF